MNKDGATIYDVARLAGVSTSTISNVLTGKHDRMSKTTLERVHKAIAELSYAPNMTARELKTGFVPIIGLIVPSVANPFWGSFARSVEHAAMARNCQVMLCNGERDPARERWYAESMLSRGIKGVIIGSSPLSLTHMAELTKRGMQVVTFDRGTQGIDDQEFDSVSVDNTIGAQIAIEHLLRLGHRRIAFVSGAISSSNRIDRLNSYMATLRSANIDPDPSLIWIENVQSSSSDESGVELGHAAALGLLRRPSPPTAFFAVNDITAFGIYAGAQELGLRVPRDISVIGFDDLDLCRVVNPPLTTLRQPLDELLRAAVELLLGRLDHSIKSSPQHITIAPGFVQRGSCGPVSQP